MNELSRGNKAIIFLASIATILLVGLLSSLLTMKGMRIFSAEDKPYFCPPPIVFSVVWTILYVLMGVSFYFIAVSDATAWMKFVAIALFTIQLILNFIWPIIFFNFNSYLLAFGWLVAMFVVVILCIISFFRIKAISGVLLIPYALWLIMAGYLNLAAVMSG